MMKSKDNKYQDVCEQIGPEDGIPPHILARQKQRQNKQRSEHRSTQLCHQIAEALQASLVCDINEPQLNELEVIEVQPGPGGISAVFVTLATRAGDSAATDQIHQNLIEAEGTLRAAVAAGIHRKRTPRLRFTVVVSRD